MTISTSTVACERIFVTSGYFYPKMPNGKRKKFNVYAKTKEECEQALAVMIAEKKTEIANEKTKMARA